MTRIFDFFKSKVWILICGLPLTSAFPQTNTKADLRIADYNFENGNYETAIVHYNNYLRYDNRDLKAIERVAFSLLKVRDLTGAIRRYRSLLTTRAGKEPAILFHLAKAYHLNEEYSEAIKYYKESLIASKQTDGLHLLAIDQIKRCGVGVSNSTLKKGMLIENLGPDVNTSYDDFGPIESPNISNRIYFTSNRSTAIVDLLGKRDKVIGQREEQNSDLFVAEIQEGVWSGSQFMNVRLNSPQNEILGGFTSDGSIAYFWRGYEAQNGRWHVDSFRAENSSGVNWNDAPFYRNSYQSGIYFYSDSVLLFSSNRPGGFGGFDLYYSVLQNGTWTHPQNLGSEINTPFDEITPFLAIDGTTVYFSSNCLTSMGDFDVFKARFERRTNQWISSENVGKPINSAGRDVGYHISWDGKFAFLGSDRNGGLGGLDLYSVYFYEPLSEQSIHSPVWFEDPQNTFNRPETLTGTILDPGSEKYRNYKLPVIEYSDHSEVINGMNAGTLDSLLNFLIDHPVYGISIFGIPSSTSDKNLELFLSVQTAKQVADYLRQGGVSASRLFIRCFVNQNARSDLDQKIDRDNHRIEFSVFHTDSTYSGFQQEDGFFWNKINGITFSVQFIETTQMYKGNILNEFPSGTVELVNVSTIMRYCSGIFKSLAQARDHFNQLRERNVSKAYIVPYLDGKRLNSEDITEDILVKYPELKDFMFDQN